LLLIKSRPNKHQRSDKTHLELLRNNLRIKFHIAKKKGGNADGCSGRWTVRGTQL
jgi:hypothetical protein